MACEGPKESPKPDSKSTSTDTKKPDGTHLYVADLFNNVIRKVVIATGVVTTFAGSGAAGDSDGVGAAAEFARPVAMTSDGTYLYVTDSDNLTIRKIEISTATVTTLAGTAGVSGDTDGTGAAARFAYPEGITTDGTNLYVTDSNNNSIRKIVIDTAVVTTIAGDSTTAGDADGTGTAAKFTSPSGIETDGTNLYVTDRTMATIRKIVIDTAVVTTIAGSSGNAWHTDAIGTNAQFVEPKGIAKIGDYLYILDKTTIRKLRLSDATVTTFIGSSLLVGPYLGDSDESLSEALAVNLNGIFYEESNNRIFFTTNTGIRVVE